MMRMFLCVAVLLLFAGCHKTIDRPADTNTSDSNDFVTYTIKAGAHYVSNNMFKPVTTSRFNFLVQFDSSAVYQSFDAGNQYDINKLYGFSDNDSAHHRYSARFGWRWSDGALRLFGYVYNKGVVTAAEVGVVPIGAVLHCSIEVTPECYWFYCNEYRQMLPRKSTTAQGVGYRLYPYFGGDETAPHDVTIRVKDL